MVALTTRARGLGPIVLTSIGALVIGAGWLTHRIVAGSWFAMTWIAAAFMEGWASAQRPRVVS